ncbi:MAG: hybrid sensor histidine kinase/response regulator, partial [Chloroflexi bacterium]|nr:hybrid sensor histidine kinase/response regulator [Chloroflexota bacterium]
MSQPDEIRDQLMAIFQAELDEHLGVLDKGLLALEQGLAPDARATLLATMFRAAHSLKGAARAVGLKDIETVAHRIEDALGLVRQGELAIMPHHAESAFSIDVLLSAVDAIRAIMAAELRHETLPREFLNSLYEGLEALTQGLASTSMPSNDRADVGQAPLEAAGSQAHAEQPGAQPGVADTVAHAAPAPEQPPAIPRQPPLTAGAGLPDWAATTDDTIRVSTAKLDALMDQLGELLVVRMRMTQLLEQVHLLQQHATAWQKEWYKVRPYWNRLRGELPDSPNARRMVDAVAANKNRITSINAELAVLLRRASSGYGHLQLVTSNLQDNIRNIRMLPIATLFDFFPRMVRDLAREWGKEVLLQIDGTDTEVDRQMLQLIRDPLTQLVRNAIDHGIEPPDQRVVNGKPSHGVLRLRAEQLGDRLVLEVSDDGRGIDHNALRQAAVERGMLSAQQADALDEQSALDLIFRSHLSTARQVSNISGRGVGMDVVRENVEQLRGQIQVQTRVGQGTCFTLTLPLTLATSDILLVKVAGRTVALPLTNVERVLRIDASQVGAIEGRPTIHTGGQILPFFDLAQILDLPPAEQPKVPGGLTVVAVPTAVVVISIADKRIAVRVDGFLSTQEVVIKPLGRQVRRVRNIAGAAILGDGQVVLILNVSDFIKSVQAKPIAKAVTPDAPRPARRRVLVVDDSITTRTLVKQILGTTGYDVLTAADGREAWKLICDMHSAGMPATPLPDIVVSDVDMPEMDGFALTATIKGDGRTAHLP